MTNLYAFFGRLLFVAALFALALYGVYSLLTKYVPFV